MSPFFINSNPSSNDANGNWCVTTPSVGKYCYPLVIDGIQKGDFPTEGVVTHQLPLASFEEGFELMKKGDKSLKVVLVQ